MQRLKNFFYGFSLNFAAPLVYLILVASTASSADEIAKTLTGNPALSVFQLVVIPMIGGVLASAYLKRDWLTLRAYHAKLAATFSFLVFAAFAIFTIVDSRQALNLRTPEPLEWRSQDLRTAFFRLDDSIRASLETRATACADTVGNPGAARSCLAERVPPLCPSIIRGAAAAHPCYVALRDSLLPSKEVLLFRDMGWLSWWQRLMTLQAAVLATVILTSLLMVRIGALQGGLIKRALVDALALFTIWIPCRVYSDWHASFGVLSDLRQSTALVLVTLAILAALGVAYLQTLETPATQKIGGLVGVISTLAGIVAAVKPAALQAVGDWLVRAPIAMLFVFEGVLFTLLFVLFGPPLGKVAKSRGPSRLE